MDFQVTTPDGPKLSSPDSSGRGAGWTAQWLSRSSLVPMTVRSKVQALVSLGLLSLFSVKANLSFYTFFKCFRYLPGGSFAKLTVGSPSLLPFISSVFNVSRFYSRPRRGLGPRQTCSFWSLMFLESICAALGS